MTIMMMKSDGDDDHVEDDDAAFYMNPHATTKMRMMTMMMTKIITRVGADVGVEGSAFCAFRLLMCSRTCSSLNPNGHGRQEVLLLMWW